LIFAHYDEVMLTQPTGRAAPTLATTYGHTPIAHVGDPRLPHRDPTQLRFDSNPAAVDAAFDRLSLMIDAHKSKTGANDADAERVGNSGGAVGSARFTAGDRAGNAAVSAGEGSSIGGDGRSRGGPGSTSVAASGTAASPSLGGFEDNGDGSFFLTGVHGDDGGGANNGGSVWGVQGGAQPKLDATARLMLELGLDMGDGTVVGQQQAPD
jgi:hypothetical protein